VATVDASEASSMATSVRRISEGCSLAVY
jgi:hypothetical protein